MNLESKLTANIMSGLVAVRYIKQPIRLLYLLSSTFSAPSSLLNFSFHWCAGAFAIFHMKFFEYFPCVLFLAYEDSIMILLHFHAQKIGHQAKVCHLKYFEHFSFKLLYQFLITSCNK
ncbi:LOW QUALITY PROTEIN: hypothetical protein TorRG33x02_070640 [Trema orientale]|uniref:Uncharacterized protein n=1 Tax=Trema orientale TaxID=63057 RepID=A0A2P5FGU8_TREOI|nr:LOW QUALITY PROTEIN: hypothetical protein TorRG33x02_070640 [Trema orientale]